MNFTTKDTKSTKGAKPSLIADRPVVSLADAVQAGYHALAGPYTREEHWMLEGVIADMERGKRRYVLVEEPRTGLLSIYIRYVVFSGEAVAA